MLRAEGECCYCAATVRLVTSTKTLRFLFLVSSSVYHWQGCLPQIVNVTCEQRFSPVQFVLKAHTLSSCLNTNPLLCFVVERFQEIRPNDAPTRYLRQLLRNCPVYTSIAVSDLTPRRRKPPCPRWLHILSSSSMWSSVTVLGA